MVTYDLLVLIPILPLLGATVLCLFGCRMERGLVSLIALVSVLGSFLVTLVATWLLVTQGGRLESTLFSWIAVGRYRFDFVLGLDALSAALILVVTGVGFLIHIYSTEYMRDDPSFSRYFAYLNFFIFAMSVLVLGRSLPVMFVGWEGVGLASYLLIGFWYADSEKSKAGKKAFITNRIGDFGFLLGMFTLLALFGTLDFVELERAISANVPSLAATHEVLRSGVFSGFTIGTVLTGACLCLFLGATGKSAQFPLFVWLPDAMAGPTPVSALIHAATMVTAGVYMIARLHFLFDLSPFAQTVIAAVGLFTALMAASIALAQDDIKRVLAYSTVSQLGFMFLAAGVGAYGAAVFHLVTHAFFKGCLFLCSGAVIHALHGEQDMRKMGGLKKKIPAVYWTMLLSTLALAGFPLTSGFFSKDAILAHAFERAPALWALGLLGACMTSIYMSRLICLTFLDRKLARSETNDPHAHVHLPGGAMTVPLVILAILSVVAGVLNLPALGIPGSQWLERALASTLRSPEPSHLSHAFEVGLMALSGTIAVAGLGVGWLVYRRGPSQAMASFTSGGIGRVLHVFLSGKWFFDETYEVLIRLLKLLASAFSAIVDPLLIDGLAVKGIGYVVVGAGKTLRKLQTGNVQSYAAVFVIATAVIILWTAH